MLRSLLHVAAVLALLCLGVSTAVLSWDAHRLLVDADRQVELTAEAAQAALSSVDHAGGELAFEAYDLDLRCSQKALQLKPNSNSRIYTDNGSYCFLGQDARNGVVCTDPMIIKSVPWVTPR